MKHIDAEVVKDIFGMNDTKEEKKNRLAERIKKLIKDL